MKYTNEIVIDRPRGEVVALFDDPDNMKEWMTGLLSFEPISGTPGQVGAKSKLVFKQGGGTLEMVETITSRNLPDEFSGTYEAKGVWNGQTNRFVDLGGQTRWTAETEFRMSGLLMKAMGWLLPGMFRKQSLAFMESFKRFAESQPR